MNKWGLVRAIARREGQVLAMNHEEAQAKAVWSHKWLHISRREDWFFLEEVEGKSHAKNQKRQAFIFHVLSLVVR
ncbi:hypothetical protein GJ744_007022 [Endocarpon pusillum]|uniref:Uncharacterized protein n=1 Tax=Endocarpon pusillum TaxID=364733 RepID=A0A8H7AJ95_9EURO|nr:hypothetical protein GJ744_007022 [Endocarpon pusillum]